MNIHIPEYMKIRQYLVNVVTRANGKVVKVLPERKMCERFGVSRGTVRKALSDLVSEGFLISKQGMGTFINPERVQKDKQEKAIKVGIILSTGMLVNITPLYQDCLRGAMNIFAKRNIIVQFLNFAYSEPEKIFQEIINFNLDAFLWFFPSKTNYDAIQYLYEKNVILFIASRHILPEWKYTVTDGYLSTMLEEVEYLIDHAGANVAYVGRDDSNPECLHFYNEFEKVFIKRGLKRDPELTFPNCGDQSELNQRLKSNPPEALYSQGAYLPEVVNVLTENINNLPSGFELLCCDSPILTPLAGKIDIRRIFNKNNLNLGKMAARALADNLKKSNKKALHIDTPSKIKFIHAELE